jgi:hypothetical protein
LRERERECEKEGEKKIGRKKVCIYVERWTERVERIWRLFLRTVSFLLAPNG